jgi:hypothetical protein
MKHRTNVKISIGRQRLAEILANLPVNSRLVLSEADNLTVYDGLGDLDQWKLLGYIDLEKEAFVAFTPD